MKRATLRCPYCGAKATLHAANYVYGDAADPGSFLYVCDRYPRCDAYVGAHRKSRLPMGIPANGALRHKRIEAHRAFDRLWLSGAMTKNQAYRWMQYTLGLPPEQAHIAQMGPYRCGRLIAACRQMENRHSAA